MHFLIISAKTKAWIILIEAAIPMVKNVIPRPVYWNFINKIDKQKVFTAMFFYFFLGYKISISIKFKQ